MEAWESADLCHNFLEHLRKRPNRGPSRAGPSPSPVGRDCAVNLSGHDLDILHGSELDLSLTVATPSMGMVALCSCFDVFRCYVRM